MAINIDIISDVKGFIKGTDNMSDALKDVASDLDDLGTSGDKALSKVEKATDDAADSAKTMDKKVSNAFKSIADEADKSGKGIGKSAKQGFKEASEGSDALKENSKQNAKEVAASFDGSAQSISDGFQGLAAEAFEGFGPAGLIAGTAIAGGIGIASSALQGMADEANTAAQNVSDLAGEIIDAGGSLKDVDFTDRMKTWGLAIQDTKEWWEIFQDKAKNGFDVIQEKAGKAGVDWAEAFKATQGPMEDAQKFLDDTAGAYDDLTKKIAEHTTVSEYGQQVLDDDGVALEKKRSALGDLRDQTQKNIKTQQDAQKASDDEATATGGVTKAVQDQIDAKNALRDANRASQDAELNLAEAQDNTTEALSKAEKTMDIHTKAGRENRKTVMDQIDAMNAWGQSQVDAGADVEATKSQIEAQSQALVDQLTPFFGSKQAAEDYVSSLTKVPASKKTTIELDKQQAERDLEAWKNSYHGLKVTLEPDGTAVANYLTAANGSKIFVDVLPRGGGVAISN